MESDFTPDGILDPRREILIDESGAIIRIYDGQVIGYVEPQELTRERECWSLSIEREYRFEGEEFDADRDSE